MAFYTSDVFVLVCVLVCMRKIYTWRKRRSSLPPPPGPKGLPVLGNVFDLQERDIWETARRWGEKYGPLVYVNTLGTPYIFVNSYEAALELFEKRGSIYSARPMNTMMKLERWEWFLSVMPYGDELRRLRQLLHRFLQIGAMSNYDGIQTQTAHRMLARLLENPESFLDILRQSAGESIIMLTYGYWPPKDDPSIELADRGVAAVTETFELFVVNALPMLQYLPSWFPGTGFKQIVKDGRKASMDMYHEPYKIAREKLAEGKAEPSMLSKLLDARLAGDAVLSDETLIAKATSVTYAAGADTSVSALHSFLLAMLLHPDAQKHAQDELDRVVGKDTLPSFEDRHKLPYLDAVLKETARWQPVGPVALTHVSTQDDVYNDYFIPAGTNLIPNVWAMHRDPNIYPEPERFIPERWLVEEGKEPPLDVYKTFFGFGRRICPGRHFAASSAFIGAASILAAFNISKALDETGVPITPKAEYTKQVVRHPKPFKYLLTPRSDKIKTVIMQAVEAEN